MKVLYILNNAPNYRDVFLKELGKHVDLTVVSFSGAKINLKDPEYREGYKYIELEYRTFKNISFQTREFSIVSKDYDVVILGYSLRNPFRILNVFRSHKNILFAGLIYGRNQGNFISGIMRKFILGRAKGVLVYTEAVKERLAKEINVPILSFNNTSFLKSEIKPLKFEFKSNELNLIWVGRYKKIKKVEALVKLARKYKNINLKLIGPNLAENIVLREDDFNISILGEVYSEDLEKHYEWSHAVFSPGHIGLLVMNTARYGRPIFIDSKTRHAPEIQLAKEANQLFLDFENKEEVDKLISLCISDRAFLIEQGINLAQTMSEKFTVEYMVQQTLKGINNNWNN